MTASTPLALDLEWSAADLTASVAPLISFPLGALDLPTNPTTGVDAAYDVVVQANGNLVVLGESSGNLILGSYLGTVMDLTPPPVPNFTGLETDSGVVGDRYTNDVTPLIQGLAEAGSTVSLFRDGVLVGTVVADTTGQWSFQSESLTDGSYAWSASAQDAAGNTSVRSADWSTTIDTLLPSVSLIPNISFQTSTVESITLEFSEILGANGVGLEDLVLRRDGVAIALDTLVDPSTGTPAAQLTSSDGQTWTLGISGNVMQIPGRYQIGIASTHDLSDRAGNLLSANVSTAWQVLSPPSL